MAQYWRKGKNFQIIALFGTQTYLATWSKAMSPCPEGVEVVVRWLRQIVVVLSHLERENKTQSREKQDGPYRRNRGHEADVVPLLHSVAGRSFVVGERVAVVTWECGIVSHIWVLQLFSLGNLC